MKLDKFDKEYLRRLRAEIKATLKRHGRDGGAMSTAVDFFNSNAIQSVPDKVPEESRQFIDLFEVYCDFECYANGFTADPDYPKPEERGWRHIGGDGNGVWIKGDVMVTYFDGDLPRIIGFKK